MPLDWGVGGLECRSHLIGSKHSFSAVILHGSRCNDLEFISHYFQNGILPCNLTHLD